MFRTADETAAAASWDSERRDSPFSTVADVEDTFCDACGDAKTCSDCLAAMPAEELQAATATAWNRYSTAATKARGQGTPSARKAQALGETWRLLNDELLRRREALEAVDPLGETTGKTEAAPEIRELIAEREILDRFDTLRRSLGHDYGAGQRARELRNRERELDRLDPLHNEPPVTDAEIVAAFERIAPARIARIDREDFRRSTPATKRTIQAWTRLAGRIDELRVLEADRDAGLGVAGSRAATDVAIALESPDRDPAIDYFAQVVEARVKRGVVNAEVYLAGTRSHLAEDRIVAGHRRTAGVDSQADYDRKIERLDLKLAELDRIEAELEAAKTSTLVAQVEGSPRCVNCGGYADPAGTVGDAEAGCSCVGDHSPAWKRDSVKELELRADALAQIIERMRGDQGRRREGPEGAKTDEPGDRYQRRMEAWRVEWDARFEELRWIAERIAELTALDETAAIELAAAALLREAESQKRMARSHYITPPAFRNAHALQRVALAIVEERELDETHVAIRVPKAALEMLAAAASAGWMTDAERESLESVRAQIETAGPVEKPPRELRDALGAELFEEPDAILEAIVNAEVGDVSETTRELARLELETRKGARA